MAIKTTKMKGWGFVAAILVLCLATMGSIVLGYTEVTLNHLYQVLFHFEQFKESNTHIIILEARIPRALIAICVGASLAIAGVLMQALTRNPLASPSIFGINAGASLFIVVVIIYIPSISLQGMTWVSFTGAAAASLIVYAVGGLGREGLTPLRLTLAGAAIAALFSSLTQGLLVLNEKALDEVLFWLAGSVQGRGLQYLYPVLPYFIGAWAGSLLISRHINILIMGEDVAQSLGGRIAVIKAIAGILIVGLAGGAVAVAGPIVFIGIVVPHFARAIAGQDHRWVIPYSGVLGAVLLLLADISARFIIMPEEVPVGVMTAIIGTPFFVYLARKGWKES
ncbi:FecCD family ABC transporter permease [Alteribacillus bidgolensis]|uniref:Iron complex transport system permease protein n=1 Tax=Alteribacillus bidgolensis TaxID=930129 RepID=A0A1G8ML31_9BACI|nr:iron ABC transporter permease [Alteribacillus bidgolensis]SDI68030.1 iron complex transport system permease protein [Alteribacillus bidgolensis]